MKFTWLTDIHLNFLNDSGCKDFYQKILVTQCDAVFITGDIAEAPCLTDILNEMANHIKKPIYFILGNHDYYRGQIKDVRGGMTALTKANDNLFWLPASGIQQLDNAIFLLGQDGWADGRFGDYQNSNVTLNDSRMITDLYQAKLYGKFKLLEKMQQLADADAMELHNNLIDAVHQNPKRIIVLTHVPPFKEICLHNGQISDENWLPYFSSKATGDVLLKYAQENPSVEFLVLCGHTHSKGKYKPLENLMVKAGAAEYYEPEVQEVITI